MCHDEEYHDPRLLNKLISKSATRHDFLFPVPFPQCSCTNPAQFVSTKTASDMERKGRGGLVLVEKVSIIFRLKGWGARTNKCIESVLCMVKYDYMVNLTFAIMTNLQSRDIPDPKNILPDDKKRKRNATNRAQEFDFYIKTVVSWRPRLEATPTAPRLMLILEYFFKSYYKELAESRSSLKISIPPNLTAMLLSASELHARGRFFHCPSDVEPTNQGQGQGERRRQILSAAET